jgi:D-3-phosphoglycerate dehydrogenase
MFKILVSDPLSKEGLEILNKESDFEVTVNTKFKPEELKKEIGKYDVLIVRSNTKVTREIIESGEKLRIIARAGVGVDNVDVDSATKCGIIVMNAPGGNTISTAEHTMSMLLSLSRNIPQANASIRRGEWERKKFIGVELQGKILGIIGLGRVGAEVAKRALSFGMRILAYDPYLSTEKAERLGVRVTDLDTLFRQSDYITVHVPMTDETKYMLSEKEFAVMKPGVRIINCARGGIIDEKALYNAIKDGRVAGAALDVFEEEPPQNNPLLTLDNVVTTPHLGASTEEAQVNVAIDVARQVVDALHDRAVRNAVNFPSLEPEVLKVLKPYLDLTQKLGALLAQLADGRISEVRVRYSGEITNYDISALTGALMKGILTVVLKNPVNYVNAQVLAKERGIKVLETKTTELEDYANLISIDVVTEKGLYQAEGTLFTNKDPRIVKINEFHVDAIPQGYMLVTSNLDKPGVVGQTGTILGKNKINIAGMTFGRQSPGGNAITVLNVDSKVPQDVLDVIRSSENILDVKLIKL